MREPEPKADLDDESGTYPSAETTKARMLRERAQARLQSAHIPEDLRDLSTEAAKSLLHELRVHQIELELQNEELRSSQEALEESRARFFDLYDLAPVGYVTISANGLVQEANLTATTLLNIPRSALLKQPWTRFVLAEDQDIYLMHCRRLLASGAPDGCELRLLKSNGDPFWVRLEARLVNSTGACRTVLSDISERKQFEATLATRAQT